MGYSVEKDMYPFVCEWLNKFLLDRYKHSQIKVFDSSRKKLNILISEQDLNTGLPPEYITWEIQVDIVGFVISSKETNIAFVECKNDYINLRDLSQLLGYSRIVRPFLSFLISPFGISDSLLTLLKTYNRIDILHYHNILGKNPKSLIISKWDYNSNSIDYSSIIAANGIHL